MALAFFNASALRWHLDPNVLHFAFVFSAFFFLLVVNVDFLHKQYIRILFTKITNITFQQFFIKN